MPRYTYGYGRVGNFGMGTTTDYEQGRAWEKKEYGNLFDRLLSPEEWDRLDNSIKEKIGVMGYMGYVNAFQSRKSRTQQRKTAYEQARSGTYKPSPYKIGYGMPVKGTQKQKATTKATGIPSYKTHRDISGKITRVPTGGRRTLEGEWIPQTIEDIEAGERLRTAVPGIKAETAGELATKQMKALAAKRGLKAEEYLATKTSEELYGLTKRGQAQQRIEQAGTRLELQDEKYKSRLTDYEYKAKVKQDYRQANITMYEELRAAREELKNKYDIEKLKKLGKIPDTDESKKRIIEELEFQKGKAEINAAKAKTLADQRFHNRMSINLDAQIFWLARMLVKPKTIDELLAERMAKRKGEDTVDSRAGVRELLAEKEAEREAIEEQERPPVEGAYWSEKKERWWIKNPDGSIKWL